MKKNKLNKKGFTLIEVVLVLAIGGLIFLLAFLAFQQTSRNRRDTQRRADVGRVIAELQNYYSDNNAYPAASVNVAAADVCTAGGTTDFVTFLSKYVCSNGFKSPSGNANYSTKATFDAKDQIKFSSGACPNGSGTNKVEVTLDNGTSTYCRDL